MSPVREETARCNVFNMRWLTTHDPTQKLLALAARPPMAMQHPQSPKHTPKSGAGASLTDGTADWRWRTKGCMSLWMQGQLPAGATASPADDSEPSPFLLSDERRPLQWLSRQNATTYLPIDIAVMSTTSRSTAMTVELVSGERRGEFGFLHLRKTGRTLRGEGRFNHHE